LDFIVQQNAKAKKIRTESGVWIPATYKTNRYNMWKEKSKISAMNDDDSEEENAPQQKRKLISLLKSDLIQSRYILCIYFICILVHTTGNVHWARHNQKLLDKKAKDKLKRPEQILKARKLLERKQQRNGRKGKRNVQKGKNQKNKWKR